MAGRKLRFDTAHTVAVPHLHGGLSESENTTAATNPGSAENVKTPNDLRALRRATHEPRLDDRTSLEQDSANELERLVQRTLDSQPAVNFSSLEIRQIEGGICLEGVLETNDQPPDIEHLIRSVVNVDRILNRLIARQLHKPEN